MNPLVAATALAFGALLAGNLVRVPLMSAASKEAGVVPLDLCVVIILAVGLLEALRARRWPVDRPLQWGLAFVAVAIVGLLTAPVRVGLSARELVFSGAYLVRWSAYFGVALVFASFLRGRESVLVVRMFGVTVAGFAAFGIVQSIFLPDFAQIVYPESVPYVDWDPQRHRLVSTFLDPNNAGIVIVTGLCWWGGRFIAGMRASWWEGALLGVALLLTLSRGATLACAAAGVTLLLARGLSRRVLRGVFLALVAVIVSLPLLLPYAAPYGKLGIDVSALQRVLAWQRSLIMLSDYPMLGIGFNTTGFVMPRYGWLTVGAASFGLDGGLLFIAALTGLLGVACFVAMLVGFVRAARQMWQPDRTAEERALGYAAASSLVAVTLHAAFANSLMVSLILFPSWILWSAPLAMRNGTRR